MNNCAYCGRPTSGGYSIHRDGMDEGPEVPLCDDCGSEAPPTLEEIWAKIANPEPVIKAIREAQEAQALAQTTVEIWREDHQTSS